MNLWGFRCFHCQKTLHISAYGFCYRCTALIKQSPYCTRCGSPLLHYHDGCGNCQHNDIKWQKIVQISHYYAPLATWIHRFKFQNQPYLDEALARLLLLAIKNAQREYHLQLPQVIFPVPLFWQRQWLRGYNQAELLSVHLARWLNIPLNKTALTRTQATRSQRHLSASQRRANVKNAFYYQPQHCYQRVALVDDVITTGSTLNAICSQLHKHGITDIQVWTLARA